MPLAIRSKIPIKRDLSVKRGATFKFSLRLKENDNVTVINTTGYDCVMRIKDGPYGETFDTLTVGDGITHTPANGLFNFERSKAQVEAWNFERAYFDILITTDLGKVECPRYGALIVIP